MLYALVCLWSLIYICLAEPSEWRHWLRKTEQLRGGVRSILWWYGGRICGGRCDREWACTLTHARSFLIMYSMARRACTPSRSSERVGQSSYGRQRWRCCGGGSGQTWPHASGPSQGSWWACRCRGPRRCRHILCDRPKHGLLRQQHTFKLLLRKPRVLLALAQVLSMCCPQDRSECRVTDPDRGTWWRTLAQVCRFRFT